MIPGTETDQCPACCEDWIGEVQLKRPVVGEVDTVSFTSETHPTRQAMIIYDLIRLLTERALLDKATWASKSTVPVMDSSSRDINSVEARSDAVLRPRAVASSMLERPSAI